MGRIYDPQGKPYLLLWTETLMEEIQALSGHWPEEQIHFEDFNPQSGREYINLPFVVSIKSTGELSG